MYVNPDHEKAAEHVKQGNYITALELFDIALQQAPDHADIISDRGVCRFHLKDIQGAMKDLNRALELEPEKPYRYSSRAYLKGVTGDIEGAIVDYEKCIELDKEDAIALNNLGLMLEKQGYSSQAKQYFERADKLAKIEKSFEKGLESQPQSEVGTKEDVPEQEEPPTFGGELKKAVLTKEGRREFWRFIRNGFKIK